MFFRRVLAPAVAVAVFSSGCRLLRPVNPQGESAPRAESTDTTTMAAAQPTDTTTARPAAVAPLTESSDRPIDPGTVNDATIAAMLLASNNTDISYARLAPTRAEREDVKEFARRMLTDHIGVNGLLTSLLQKIDLTPEDNGASLDLRDESAAKRDVLRELSGFAFDSTYIENEVSYHRRFLYNIDNVMQARARNDELKTLLSNIRPAIAAHLAHAEQVRANVLTRKK